MSTNAMRQLEERHVAIKIELMVWSTKMDLLALSYANGDVALHRLNWLKVWVFQAPSEGITVKGIAWRPDGKVIAIGYSSRDLVLVDVENKELLNIARLDGDITSLTWTQDKKQCFPKKTSLSTQKRAKEFNLKDECTVFLPKLASLTRSFGPGTLSSPEDHADDARKIKDQKSLNLLLVGLNNGELYVSVFGLFPSAIIDIKKYVNGRDCIILDSNISKDLKIIFVVVSLKMDESEKSTISVLLLNADILASNCRELHTLAMKYGHIASSMDYLQQTLVNITESWENILIEMDSKLTTYASKVPPGRVSSDFLELLMFGTPSPEMGVFLLQELTERGLKKLGNSIEMSYINIQKLVLKHLQSVGQNLSYHLDELCGLSRCPNYFQMLGLEETLCNTAFVATGSFLIKGTEVQQVIDDSLKKYKAFFRWLYATILRLSDERVSPEISKVSQQDLQYISEYLYNFEGEDQSSDSKKAKFNLEKLGQYLLDRNLDILPDYTNEYWANFLEKKYPAINEHFSIIPHHKEMSLIQEMKHLEKQVNRVFKNSEEFIGRHFKLLHVQNFIQVYEPYIKLTNVYVSEEEKFLFAILDPKSPSNGFYFLDVSIYPELHQPKCVYLSVNSVEDSSNRIIDVQFYSPDVLSILIEQKLTARQAGFVQLPIKILKDLAQDFSSCVDIEHILENFLRSIDGIVASGFAVSGSRKVAVVLSESRRKVKLFEMEVEEDEDEDDVMEASTSFKDTSADSSTCAKKVAEKASSTDPSE